MEVQNSLKTSAVLIQCFATLLVCLQATLGGLVTAWPSHTIEPFKSNETVLSRPMTSLDVSWLGSVLNIGGLLGSLTYGYSCDTIGRKYTTIIFGTIFIISWLMITFTTSVEVVLCATLIAGIGMSGSKQMVIFVSEFSHVSIRGAMMSCSGTMFFFGLFLSHIFAGYLSYYQVLYLYLVLNTLCVASVFLLKESPVFLVMMKREEEAAKSIAFYNRVEASSKLVEIEIEKIKQQIGLRTNTYLEGEKDVEMIDKLIEKNVEPVEVNNEPQWKLLQKSESSKRALLSVIIVHTFTAFMGNSAVQVYTEPLFKEAVPSMSSNLCAIILALDFVIASSICVVAIEKIGRRSLLSVTSTLSGICCLLLGAQLQLHWLPHWVTALLIYLYGFVFTLGCSIMPCALMGEVFLPEVRTFCSSILMFYAWITWFFILFVFNPMVESFGLGVVFYCFSAVCFSCTIYTHFKLPETKGLSTNEIQKAFLAK